MRKQGTYIKHKWYIRWWVRVLRLWLSVPATSRRTGVPMSTIKDWVPGRDRIYAKKQAKKWAIADPLLGKHYDREVGRRSGLSYDSIQKRRHKLEISPFQPSGPPRNTPAERTSNDYEVRQRKLAEEQVRNELLRKFGGGKLMDAEMKAFLLEKDMRELEKKYG